MKIIQISMARTLFLFFILLVWKQSMAQANLFDPYYQGLYTKLQPDTLMIVDIQGTFQRGAINFMLFKNGEIKTGYYLPGQIVTEWLLPYMFNPKDSTIEDVIVFTDSSHLREKVPSLKLETLRNLPKDIPCYLRQPTDGTYYSVTFYSEKCSWSKEYYELYLFLEKCKGVNEFQSVGDLVHFFREIFDTSKLRAQIVERFKSRTGKPVRTQ